MFFYDILVFLCFFFYVFLFFFSEKKTSLKRNKIPKKNIFQKFSFKIFLKFFLFFIYFSLFSTKRRKTTEKNCRQNGTILFSYDSNFESVETTDSQKIDISFLKDPGVYEILDRQNNCSYYGELGYLLSRFQIHWRQ